MNWFGIVRIRGTANRLQTEELLEAAIRDLQERWGVRLSHPRHIPQIKTWLFPYGPGDEGALVYQSLRRQILRMSE
jgi:hypothetical protein